MKPSPQTQGGAHFRAFLVAPLGAIEWLLFLSGVSAGCVAGGIFWMLL